MTGTVPFAITMYALKIFVVPFAILYTGYFYCHVPLELC